MKKTIILLFIVFISCKPGTPVRLCYDNAKGPKMDNKRYWYITVNNEYIDTTATFDYQLAYKYYLTLKKRYND